MPLPFGSLSGEPQPKKERGWFDDWFGGPDEPSLQPLNPGLPFGSLDKPAPSTEELLAGSAWSPAEGAGMSTLSAIPELFGFDPLPGVENWRAEHPVLDLTTTLLGSLVPYAGVEIASTRIPSAARALEAVTEGTVKAFGSTSARSPIVSGALKEMYRYSPLELARLGTGWANDDLGGMFADVAVSQALAGSLGGLGGFLRAGGRAAEKAARLAEGEQGLLPNFELARALEPSSTVLDGRGQVIDKAQYIYDKQQEALRYVPESWRQSGTGGGPAKTLQGRYTFDVQGLAPEDANWLEGNFFKPNSPNVGPEKLAEQLTDVRQLHSDTRAWSMDSPEAAEDFARRAGFTGIEQLAADVAFPRRVVVQSATNGRTSGPGQFGAWMDRAVNSGALKAVDDETWLMQEDGGLWIGIKRVSRGTEPPKVEGNRRSQFQYGKNKVRAGDEFLIGKTAKPEVFAPKAAKVQQMTLQDWAKFKDPYRQLISSNPFMAEMNLIQRAISHEDWAALRNLNRQKGVSYMTQKLGAALKAEANLTDQATVRAFAEKLYDVSSPKLLKMQKDPYYGRFYTMLEGSMRFADDVKQRLLYGVPESQGSLSGALSGKDVKWRSHDGFEPIVTTLSALDDAELQQLALISNAQFPKKTLDAMRESGELSPKVANAAEKLQALNQHVLGKYVIPALEEAGRAEDIRWLEGYIMPRLYRGDSFVRVVDEAGKPQFLANGVNGKEAQQMADFVIREAALEGKAWKATEVESHAFRGIDEEDKLDEVYKMVHEQMGQSADAQAVVGKAMRKLLADRASNPTVGLPNRLRTSRTGMPGAPDVQHYSLEDMLKASGNHYQQLLRYSAAHSWKYRFGDQMLKWGQQAGNQTMYTDLQRKATQWLGVEGQITNTLNRLLAPVLGPALGGKAATRIANETNSLMYAWNLGILNPSFALLNLLTPLQTVAPWIAFMQKAPTAEVMRMMQVLPRFNAEGRVAGSYGVLAPIKVLREAMGLISKPTAELRQMFDQALSDGVLAPQLFDEFVGPTAGRVHGLREAWGKSGWEFIKEAATGMATKSEQWSRLVAFNSAYLVGKNMFGLADDALYRFTRKGVETTMYGYGVMDRSRVLTGPLGSTWGLFKNWQFHFIASQAQYAGLAVKDGIWAPMLWQGASALAIGGMGATPLVMLADGLAKWNSDSPNSFMWMRENWGEAAGDGIYFGLPALLGVSLQASSSIPGTDVTQDIESMSNIIAWQRAQAAGKAVGAAWDQWEGTGQNPLKDPNIRDKMMQAFAPRAFFRAFSSMEGDYVRSMSTGQPTVRDLPLSSRLLHSIGFNPIDIEQNYIVGESFHKMREAKRDAIQDLGEAFAQAQIAGDVETMDLVTRRAMTSGVDVSSVLRSANTRYRREMFGDHLSQYDKLDVATAEAVLGE